MASWKLQANGSINWKYNNVKTAKIDKMVRSGVIIESMMLHNNKTSIILE